MRYNRENNWAIVAGYFAFKNNTLKDLIGFTWGSERRLSMLCIGLYFITATKLGPLLVSQLQAVSS